MVPYEPQKWRAESLAERSAQIVGAQSRKRAERKQTTNLSPGFVHGTFRHGLHIVLPEEDTTKYFIVSLVIQQINAELTAMADRLGGSLPKKVLCFYDELGTIPKIEGLDAIFTASRSRNMSIVGILQGTLSLKNGMGKILLRQCLTAATIPSPALSDRCHRTQSSSQNSSAAGPPRPDLLPRMGRPANRAAHSR